MQHRLCKILCYRFLVVPPEAPIILRANSTTSTSINLKWTNVTQLHSSPLLGYVIVYKEINQKFQPNTMKSVAPSPPEAVLENLKIFTKYTIRVYAFTSNGNGVPSDAVTLGTEEDGEFRGPFRTGHTPNSKMADNCYLALDASFPRCSPQIIPSDHHFGIYFIYSFYLFAT